MADTGDRVTKKLGSALFWGIGLVLILFISIFFLYPMPFQLAPQPISNQSFLVQTNQDKVDINRAPVEELALLPGIGEKRAVAIVAHRTEYGYFKSLEDILLVSGIGEKTLANIKEYIVF